VYLGAWAEISPEKEYLYIPHVKKAQISNIIKRYIKSLLEGENRNEQVTEKLGRLDFRYNIEKDLLLAQMKRIPDLLEP
jgi:hypothetical protein